MRLFVAAALPACLREALAETSAALRSCVRGRYVPSDSFHITLAFLGEVPGAELADAIAAVDEACAGRPAIPVSLGELDAFGRSRTATLWQGVGDGAVELAELAQAVRGALKRHGLACDPHAFVPHVTLMRAADLTAGTLPPPLRSDGTIREVCLFRSDLSGPRPRYEALHTAELA